MQAADGMAYLHSSKPPTLHRDLRCANIFISNNDVVKVSYLNFLKVVFYENNQSMDFFKMGMKSFISIILLKSIYIHTIINDFAVFIID